MNEEAKPEKDVTTGSSVFQPIRDFWTKRKGEIGLAIMFIYLFLLGLGTIGEIWEVEWILDLPLFRSVGKWER